MPSFTKGGSKTNILFWVVYLLYVCVFVELVVIENTKTRSSILLIIRNITVGCTCVNSIHVQGI